MEDRIELPPAPERIHASLAAFRDELRRRKVAEAIGLVVLVALTSYLVALGLDRVVDVPAAVRAALVLVAVAAAAVVIPRALHRWVLRHRDLRDVAREVEVRDPLLGDRLLGVLELSTDAEEFARSPGLVRAAIVRGESELGERALDHAQPRSRHALFGRLLVVPALATAAVVVLAPEVAGNALLRWALPFADVPRFTFARLEGLRSDWVVPVQEESDVVLRLADESRRRPDVAELRLGRVQLAAEREGDSYRLRVPPLGAERSGLLVVGDVRESVTLVPTERPEVVDATAAVHLPDYLDLGAPVHVDVRGGALAAVEGSRVAFDLELSRDLASARRTLRFEGGEAANATDVAPSGAKLNSDPEPLSSDEGASVAFEWTDVLGLDGHAPFQVRLRALSDEAPIVTASGVAPEVVQLASNVLTFDVIASDDFGVRSVGLEWFEPARQIGDVPRSLGDRLLLSSAPDADHVEALAALRPEEVGLGAGSYLVRAWAMDALPGRERAYSSPVLVRIMTSEDHLAWVSERFEGLLQRAAEVRDHELELLAENEALLALKDAELAAPEAQRRLESQARAERMNRARLQAVVSEGAELLGDAARNDEVDANTLERWAEARETLEEIAESDMESVAELLAKAARAESSSDTPGGQEVSIAGRVLAAGGGAAEAPEGEAPDPEESVMPPTPTILDVESSLVTADEAPTEPAATEEPPTERDPADVNTPAPIGIVATTLGPGGAGAPPGGPP
ncbi:MAG: hypothetical protein AAGA20_17535, partial [Planctomycetota bacterium]